MKNKSSIAVYLRVSTKDKQSFASQRHTIEEFLLKERDGTKWSDIHLYTDKDSGSNNKRKGLEELKQDIMRGRKGIKECVIYSLDRLSRSGSHYIINFLSFINGYGCKVYFIKDTWLNHSDPMIKNIILVVLSELAAKELSRTKQRIQDGIKAYRSTNPDMPWGRKKSVDRDEVIRLYRSGLSMHAISKQMKCAYSTIHRIMTIELDVHNEGAKKAIKSNKKALKKKTD